ncbi:hypothetical protein CHH28_08065 [Bacterioplanes sanyensis]|uniref:Kinase n=1 Tax=Bacterioplanes sanyensis TaxID=1249553 RepID=A0A222FJG3_9GAMM|nr:hypothetical protein [Bacterioplanes sanyensis]ASP38634.1 hypothetical protein CHH28_08065 [Bacterioplanes sanyensis]
MNNEQATAKETDAGKWIGIGFFIGIVVAVLALEYYGFIQHSEKADAAIIDRFQLLSLAPEYETRVSPKESGKEGFCVNGYLLLRPTNGNATAGILVDGKNRGIRCRDGLAVSDQQAESQQ